MEIEPTIERQGKQQGVQQPRADLLISGHNFSFSLIQDDIARLASRSQKKRSIFTALRFRLRSAFAFPLLRCANRAFSTGVYSGLPSPIYRDRSVMIAAYY